MPVLEVDGKLIAQSNTINRDVGRQAGLYPKDDWQATLVAKHLERIGNLPKIAAYYATRGK